jgi:uncharacterized membrane protein
MLIVPMTLGQDTPKVDPQTGMVRVLFIGDAYMAPGFVTPLMAQDPMLVITPIPVEFITLQYASINAVGRAIRIYLPRVRQQVVDGYDAIILAEVREPFLPPKFQGWITDGVLDNGIGFLMGGGAQSFGGFEEWAHPSWEGSPVSDILPVTCVEGWHYYWCRLVPEKGQEDHPLVRNIPWNQIRFHKRNRVVEKQGGVVLARSDLNPPGAPILAYMEAGKGRSVAFTWNWGGDGPLEFHRWSYAPIFLSNLVYYSARVGIPEDLNAFLDVRRQIANYLSLRRYVLSVIDFADKVGANTRRAEIALSEADSDRKTVISLYVQGDYPSSLEALGSALDGLDEVTALAIQAKNDALLWVYVIEWLAVSGTGMFCGAVLWALMVRRAAYGEVGHTRFDGR